MNPTSSPIKIGILGCAGRMGRMLLAEVLDEPRAALAGGTLGPEAALAGRDLGELAGREPVGLKAGVGAGIGAADLFHAADVVIDFTQPAASVAHAALAAEHGKALVIGTTGLDAVQQQALRDEAAKAAIVFAPNMSLGVNLLLGLVRQVAASLGPDYDIEIVEMHHRHKRDAPSGTALGLGRAAAAGRGLPLEDLWVKSRDGETGPRVPGTIGFATLRGGDVVGEHSVVFASEGERIELTHKASDRRVFARGALRAALWAAGRQPGLYGMGDVLGL